MKTYALLSGGIDSTVLVQELLVQGDEVNAIAFDYGQRHQRELIAAQHVASHLGAHLDILDIGEVGALLRGSSQTDPQVNVPDGHYTDASMRVTVVPNRNMFMLSIAAAVAQAAGARFIAYAAHAGDHAIYPDCRPDFVVAMNAALREAGTEVNLLAPFISLTKTDIVKRGHLYGAPLELTWSCYRGGRLHCGRCGTCVERREAFALAEVKDPTEYEGGS